MAHRKFLRGLARNSMTCCGLKSNLWDFRAIHIPLNHNNSSAKENIYWNPTKSVQNFFETMMPYLLLSFAIFSKHRKHKIRVIYLLEPIRLENYMYLAQRLIESTQKRNKRFQGLKFYSKKVQRRACLVPSHSLPSQTLAATSCLACVWFLPHL
jgi:hypothetical protein